MNRLIMALLFLAGCSEVEETEFVVSSKPSNKIWSVCQIENPDSKTEAQIKNLMESRLGKAYKFTGIVNDVNSSALGRYYVSLTSPNPSLTRIFVSNISKEQALSLNKGAVIYVEGQITSCTYYIRSFYAHVDAESISVVHK